MKYRKLLREISVKLRSSIDKLAIASGGSAGLTIGLCLMATTGTCITATTAFVE